MVEPRSSTNEASLWVKKSPREDNVMGILRLAIYMAGLLLSAPVW